jgi:PAS domain S-box-containing protein
MIYLDLIVNLTLLVALSVVSGFIDKHWPRHTRLGVLLQGALFGGAAVIGMLRPLNLEPGLIFDGRSVMLSLCALFFGPWAASVAGLMTIACRIGLGGAGTITGVLVILSSVGIGLVAHFRLSPATKPPSTRNLYLFGLAVALVLIALMFTLPGNAGIKVVMHIGMPVMLLYPLATILAGKILADQVSAIRHVEALKKSEESLNDIVENIPIMIFMKDAANLRYVKSNKACEELLGYSREELSGKSDYDFFPKREADFFTGKDREVLHSGKLVEIPEETIQTRYLGERVLRTKKISIADKQGKPEYLLGISEDITERKRAEEAAVRAAREWQMTFDAVNDAIWLLDKEQCVVRSNKTAERFFQSPCGELVGRHCWEIVHGTTEPIQECPLPRARKSLRRETMELQVGDDWFRVTVDPILDASGQYAGTVHIVHDITERKQAEEALLTSEARYRSYIDATDQIGWVTNADGEVVEDVPSLRKFSGQSYEEAKGSGWTKALHPDDLEHSLQAWNKAVAAKSFYEIEYRMRRHDGVYKYLLARGFPVFSEDGSIREWVGTCIDITERKKAEEEIFRLNAELGKKVAERTNELRKSQLALLNLVEDMNQNTKKIDIANRALEATNKELESFSYSVSHDLRAPLRGMDGFSKTLLEDYSDKLDATGKNYLERIRAGTQRMGLLIDDLLKLSRVNRVEFKRESVDLSKMVRTMLLTVRKNNPARDVKVSIQKDIIIDGDGHLLEIAITNLIDNAWKFTGKTENTRIEFGTLLKDGKTVMFIRDNGVGFDMTYVDKLFGAFQRLHTTAEFPGTGIGLATVQRVIHRHGGQVWAEGEVGKGATFFFTLPA